MCVCNLKLFLLFVFLVFIFLFFLFLLLLHTSASVGVAETLALLHHKVAVVLIARMHPGGLARGEVEIVNVLRHILAVDAKERINCMKLIGRNIML